MGKEWTDGKGEFQHTGPQWVKTVSLDGRISNVDWVDHYETLRVATDTSSCLAASLPRHTMKKKMNTVVQILDFWPVKISRRFLY